MSIERVGPVDPLAVPANLHHLRTDPDKKYFFGGDLLRCDADEVMLAYLL
jgi:hypothetical protein